MALHLHILGACCKYLLREVEGEGGSSELCEILKFSDGPRSWFIGDSVHTGKISSQSLLQQEEKDISFVSLPHADGSLLMCTPVDPLFLALPYFASAAKVTVIFLSPEEVRSRCLLEPKMWTP